MRYLWPLILAGCASTSIEDLHQMAAACGLSESAECVQVRERLNRAEDRRLEREAGPQCPRGYVLFCVDQACALKEYTCLKLW